jgi:transcription elongation factor GreA
MQMMTKEERAELEGRVDALVKRRPVIAAAIAEAREKGDLKENADYHAARDEMARNEQMIKELEGRLKTVMVVSTDDVPEDMVFLGSTVKVKNLKTGDEESFRIVGEVKPNFDDDSDVMEVSATSPLGEALMRQRVGATVRVSAPRGELKYEILELVK